MELNKLTQDKLNEGMMSFAYIADCIIDQHGGAWPLGDGDAFSFSHDSHAVEVNKNTFTDRLNQRRNKPDWKDAPEWANWLAQDFDGEWYWFHLEPKIKTEKLFSGLGTGGSGLAAKGKVIGDWRNTLEQRPVEASSNTIANLLDKFAAASNVNDWWDYENDKPISFPPTGALASCHQGSAICFVVGMAENGMLCYQIGSEFYVSQDANDFKPKGHDRNRKPCAEFGLRMANAKNEIDAAAKLCGKNKILADAVFAIGEQIKSVKEDAE